MRLITVSALCACVGSSALAEANVLECEVLKTYTRGVSAKLEQHIEMFFLYDEAVIAILGELLNDSPGLLDEFRSRLELRGAELETKADRLREPVEGFTHFKLILDDRCGE